VERKDPDAPPMNTPSPSPPSVTAVAEGPLWIVTISRPQARNAVDMSVAHGLESAMAELDERPDLRVAILTGADGNFCAGMDLKAFAKGERPWLPALDSPAWSSGRPASRSSRRSRGMRWPVDSRSHWRATS
jgi:enoyl-CoA hydratase/carnithine racemase